MNLVTAVVALAIASGSSLALDERYQLFRTDLSDEFEQAIGANRQLDLRAVIDSFEEFGFSVGQTEAHELSDGDLRTMHAAASEAFAYTSSREIIPTLRAVTDEMMRRGMILRGQAEIQVHQALVRAQLFSEANTFATSINLETFRWELGDTFAASGEMMAAVEGPTAAIAIKREGQLIRASILSAHLTDGIQLVAIVHPNCGYSRRAMAFIEENDEFARFLPRQTYWLVSQANTAPVEPILEWNETADRTSIAIVYQEEHWPREIGFLQTPVFFLLKDGEIVDKIVGWPDPQQGPARLRTALESVLE